MLLWLEACRRVAPAALRPILPLAVATQVFQGVGRGMGSAHCAGLPETTECTLQRNNFDGAETIRPAIIKNLCRQTFVSGIKMKRVSKSSIPNRGQATMKPSSLAPLLLLLLPVAGQGAIVVN